MKVVIIFGVRKLLSSRGDVKLPLGIAPQFWTKRKKEMKDEKFGVEETWGRGRSLVSVHKKCCREGH